MMDVRVHLDHPEMAKLQAWGGAPGRRQHKREGLKARSINSFERPPRRRGNLDN
jgi:hypothetical protein